MIQREELTVNEKRFVRTWSDAGRMIERDGVLYEEAVDPAEYERTYTETEKDFDLPEGVALADLLEVLRDEES